MKYEKQLAEARANANLLLSQFKTLSAHPNADTKTRLELMQGAYELGLSFGRLEGKIEAADQIMGKPA